MGLVIFFYVQDLPGKQKYLPVLLPQHDPLDRRFCTVRLLGITAEGENVSRLEPVEPVWLKKRGSIAKIAEIAQFPGGRSVIPRLQFRLCRSVAAKRQKVKDGQKRKEQEPGGNGEKDLEK